jgi:hypothetical protein
VIHQEIKMRLNSGNACYYSDQNLLSSRLPSKNKTIRIHETTILLAALYGYETWSLSLKDEHRLREFENRMLRGIFGPKRDKVTVGWVKLQNEKLLDLYSSPSYRVEEDEVGGACGT